MKALIIAAGKGSRLNRLTEDNPKPLIQLLGLSLIERVLLTAKQAGINEFFIAFHSGITAVVYASSAIKHLYVADREKI
ncbi:MAG: NTP transferase domain-containing protein [Methanophagales archaeon]|nr:NTP transferase domain-containing protein [Methanophagales archaeon]